jgi:hypothetical protein
MIEDIFADDHVIIQVLLRRRENSRGENGGAGYQRGGACGALL